MPALQAQRQEATAQRRARVAAHEEWLLDEALMETFPASDPSSPYRFEGATAAARPRNSSSVMRVRRRGWTTLWWIMAGGAIFYAGYLARRRRR